MSARTSHAVRRQLIEALRQRAAGSEAAVRVLLEQRLRQLALDDSHAGSDPPMIQETRRGSLGQLADRLAGAAAARGRGDLSDDGAPGRPELSPPPLPEPPALGEARRLWAELRAESRLRQSLQPVPANAGPLNSGGLVHRAIARMRDLSPGYLQHFLSYADELAWMESLVGSGALATEASGGTPVRKRARRKARG
jgi:hypothetical protein